jgi:uncharacterized protein YfdQ (DUF2303 family)
MSEETASNAQAIIDHCAKTAHSTETIGVGRAADEIVLVTAKDRQIHSIQPFVDEIRSQPRRHKGFASLGTIDSFVQYCLAYRTPHTIVLVDDEPSSPSMRAVFNYHEGSSAERTSDPGFRDYGALYHFPISDEWTAWERIDGETMDQRVFAEFLEDRITDVVDPNSAAKTYSALAKTLGLEPATPGKLLALSRGLTVHASSKVAEHRNLSTGEGQVAFETTHKDERGEQLRVPGLFVIAIPVFKHEEPVPLAVRLRYRVRSGQILWTVKLHQADVAWLQAMCAVVTTVANALEGTQVLWGVQAPV